MELSLDSFSTELLLKIFKYLDICDLCRLKQTCRRFNEIIKKWDHSLSKNVVPIVTNQIHTKFLERSPHLLSPFERLRISKNWASGIYNERAVLHTRVKYIPWLQLEKTLLWVSRGRYIQAYKRNNKSINPRNVVYFINGNNNAEVCHFVKKENFVFSGQTDGSLWLWSIDKRNFVFHLENCHEDDINSVDMSDDVLVSGSKDNFVKIWHRTDNSATLYHQINLNDRVWSVALSEDDKSILAVGTAGRSRVNTIKIFDLNNQALFAKFTPHLAGAGVLDMKWESPSILWSCGYDTYVRRWDLRTGKCEQALGDPCLATIYCFQYDYTNSIISGTHNHGRVVLWDTRQDNYVQMYFMDCCRRRGKSSPVYGLSFDAENLFTVTDQYVNILDFSVYKGTAKDYSNLFGKSIKV